MRCGRCQFECPVFLQTANLWGGPVYGGPMGMGWTAITLGERLAGELSYLCLGCGRCDEVCPVEIPLSDIIRKLKSGYASGGKAG
ncbi:MAG: 4Fe-4S dicluster domain-containing protein [Aeropyrum sp.]|nr:4Fe-4S dicluster domain-containing protein [Aeropyrum sp.]MCE4616225.1 4Fe-4S dicluster domain-containing protein [Aeropyrum sp.]